MSKKKTRDPSRLAGEDLSKGPTPQTRHPQGDLDDVEDTTQGPTPETRRATRLSKAAGGEAAGEPASDRASRSPGGGTQNRDATPSDTERQVLAPGLGGGVDTGSTTRTHGLGTPRRMAHHQRRRSANDLRRRYR